MWRSICVAIGIAGSLSGLSACVVTPVHDRDRPAYRGYDEDRDGISDRHDRDRDGDGVPNRRDRRPDNPRRY